MPTPGISLFSDFKMCNVYYADRKKCPDPLLAAGVLNEIIFIFTPFSSLLRDHFLIFPFLIIFSFFILIVVFIIVASFICIILHLFSHG